MLAKDLTSCQNVMEEFELAQVPTMAVLFKYQPVESRNKHVQLSKPILQQLQ